MPILCHFFPFGLLRRHFLGHLRLADRVKEAAGSKEQSKIELVKHAFTEEEAKGCDVASPEGDRGKREERLKCRFSVFVVSVRICLRKVHCESLECEFGNLSNKKEQKVTYFRAFTKGQGGIVRVRRLIGYGVFIEGRVFDQPGGEPLKN